MTERTLRYWPKDKPIPEGWVKVSDMEGQSHGYWSIIIEKVCVKKS